ncbi:cell wall / vacuolar inhibitor of fructosidase 1-like [Silene latifolia]|uniref:cell wall / vacuolar inhibitor of fructosidase 1-like n=1 Tax=Silene latifolia TaxID=37657 RepID=UPI003D76BE6B
MNFLKHPFTCLLLITLTLSITPTYADPKPTTNDLVRTTCKQTADPTICETALRADPRSSKADTQGLILIMIDTVKTRFTDSLRYVEGMAQRTHDPAMTKALKECIHLYQLVLNTNVALAVTAVNEGDPKFGEQAMTDSGNEAEACRSAFPEGKVPGPMTGRTSELHGVSNVAASMIKILE